MGDSVPGSNGTWILAFDILSSPIRALFPLKLGWKLSAPKLRCCRLCRSVLRGILEFRHSPECLGSPGMCRFDFSHPRDGFPIPDPCLRSRLVPSSLSDWLSTYSALEMSWKTASRGLGVSRNNPGFAIKNPVNFSPRGSLPLPAAPLPEPYPSIMVKPDSSTRDIFIPRFYTPLCPPLLWEAKD